MYYKDLPTKMTAKNSHPAPTMNVTSYVAMVTC